MELELSELFPKHSDLRLQAVRLMHLSESGPQKQSHLAEELDLPLYTVSRLLNKLELHHYVTRERAGTDKIVRLKNDSS
jgi:DNA-binding MarR family transcriptional regulator